MENKIVIPTEAVKELTPTDETLKLIDDLNSIRPEDKSGEWVFSKDLGLVWKPVISAMPGSPAPGVPSPSTPPPTIRDLVNWGRAMDFDAIPQNSVMLVKLKADDPYRMNMMQKLIAKYVLEPRIDDLKKKRVCVMFMQSGDDISVMTEDEMNQAGWEKKDKSLIVTL